MSNTAKLDSSLRLLDIYLKFYKGEQFSTKTLAQLYDTTSRTILRDIEKINKFIPSKIITNRQTKLWKLQDGGKSALLNEDEQLILNILDQACIEQGDEFHKKALKLFDKFTDSLHNTIYNNIDSEDIANIKLELAKAENAVYNKNKISLTYLDKDRIVLPLKLANFEGYWYLIVQDEKDNRIKSFYFKDISNMKILNDTFTVENNIENTLKNAINTYFTVDNTPYEIKIFVSKEIANIFRRKPISKTQTILQNYADGSFDLSVVITNDMELIPKIQQFIPHLKIIDEDKHSSRIIKTILDNLKAFQSEYN